MAEQSDSINADALFKVIMIGDTGVGKSCVINRLTKDNFDEQVQVTIGVEFGNYVIRMNDRHNISLQIWDTAGQESYRNITRSFYKGSHAVVMVYSVTDADSLQNMRIWKNMIEDNCDQAVLVYMVGNRADLID